MDEMQSSQNELRATREELHAAKDELRNKVALLDEARHEASEAAISVERLTEECHGLRGDLQRQETLVVQRDGAIASLRDEACTQWASAWLAFQRKAANAYPSLDLNFDIPVTRRRKSPFSLTVLESQTPRLRPAPLLRLMLPPLTSELLHIALLVCLFVFFFFYIELRTRDICNVVLNEYPTFYFIAFIPFSFSFFITAPLMLLCLSYPGSVAIWPCLS